ncbi:MAG: glutamate--tRNA ligase [Rhodospirillales bacterium]
MPKIITRFAPSPTGFLHIGGARTALFNWLFAKHHGGKFLLRIEDTDRKRSTDGAVKAILAGMKWLGLNWDGEAYSQYERRERHTQVAMQMLADGQAYRCYCTAEELLIMRNKARADGKTRLYDGVWRDRDPSESPAGIEPVIRLRAPLDGQTTIQDSIQGRVTVSNATLDDMILLRADGTPTYMLAVVVDDHDMEISHVVRGDDHLTNTFRQIQIYNAMNWELPVFAHMPLLHGADGAKLSKRHGALGVEAYREMGFLPEAVNNYLLRLGWAHGDNEIINQKQAIEWFDLSGVGKSSSRFDMDKLNNLNSHYINQCDNAHLVELVLPKVSQLIDGGIAPEAKTRLINGMSGLKERVKNIIELADNAQIYCITRPVRIEGKAAAALDDLGLKMIEAAIQELSILELWSNKKLNQIIHKIAEKNDIGLGKIAQPLRSALSGSLPSPGIFEVMQVLGKEETLERLKDVL